MSGKALRRLFGSKLVSGAQLPQKRGVSGFAALLLCADVPQGCTESSLEASRLSAACRGFVSAGRQTAKAGGERGTSRCVLPHPIPGWSWGTASLETAFTFSLEAEIICNGLQV